MYLNSCFRGCTDDVQWCNVLMLSRLGELNVDTGLDSAKLVCKSVLRWGKHVSESELGVGFVFHSCCEVIMITLGNFLSRKYVYRLKEI